jgi:3',5'-cyclic AMP phosphodiesterase CpdA
MKIIHLSDTHIGFENNSERMQQIVDDLIQLRPLDTKDHLIIHTGDMVQDSHNAKELKYALSSLDALKEYGYRVLICPGNHDYGESKYTSKSIAVHFRSMFNDYFSLKVHSEPQSDDIFPVLNIIDNLALIGLDSCWEELGWFSGLLAEGQIGETQLEKLNQILDLPALANKKIILYLHHHPYSYGYAVKPLVTDPHGLFQSFYDVTRRFRRLKDAYTLSQIIRDRVDIMLFGHMHYGLDCSIESRRYGIAMALDASSTTATLMDTDRMRYRIIDTETMSYETRFIRL